MASESAALGARPIDTEMELMALSFDATYYFQNRPDVLKAFIESGAASAYEFALAHYNNHGWKEGANPNEVFNTDEYLTNNPDVKDAGVNPFTHYTTHGQAEGRAPNATFPALADFDWETYVNSNPDLQAAGITTKEAAYDHYITYGHAENRPGAPDNSEFKLNKAIDALKAATDARAEALAAAAKLDNGNESDGDTALTDTALEAFVAGYTAADLEAEVTGAESRLNTAQATLSTARAVDTDAKLQQNYDDALKAVNDDATAKALLQARTDARADLDADKAENGGDLDVLVALRDGLVKAIAEGLATTTEVDSAAPVTVANLLDALNSAIAAGTTGTLVADIADYDNLTELEDTAAEAAADVLVNRDTLADAVVTAENALGGDALGGTLVAAEGALETRDGLIQDVEDAQAWLAEIKAAAEAYDSADAAYEAAVDALEDLGYNAPETLGATFTGTDEGDILVYEDPETGTLTSSIADFGVSGDDMIVFGKEFKLVKLDETPDFTKGKLGDVAALEIFYEQVGDDTILYVEDDSYDATVPSAAGFTGNTITLVGVDASSITFENGILRVVTDVA
jgi:hypothetical protein